MGLKESLCNYLSNVRRPRVHEIPQLHHSYAGNNIALIFDGRVPGQLRCVGKRTSVRCAAVSLAEWIHIVYKQIGRSIGDWVGSIHVQKWWGFI